MRFNDAVIGAVLLVLSIVLMVHVSLGWSWLVATDFSGFPRAVPGRPGPALFPFTLGMLFFVCSVVLIVRGLAARGRWLVLQQWMVAPGRALNAVAVLVAVLLYQFLSEWIGFLPLAVAILFALMKLFGVRTPVALASSGACALFIHTLFVKLLLVPLPWGLLDAIAW